MIIKVYSNYFTSRKISKPSFKKLSQRLFIKISLKIAMNLFKTQISPNSLIISFLAILLLY
jgi:hypothetical protein